MESFTEYFVFIGQTNASRFCSWTNWDEIWQKVFFERGITWFQSGTPKLVILNLFWQKFKKIKFQGAQILNELGPCSSISLKKIPGQVRHHVSDMVSNLTNTWDLKKPMCVFGASALHFGWQFMEPKSLNSKSRSIETCASVILILWSLNYKWNCQPKI